MLVQIADGVLVHKSDFMQSNTVVVEGTNGVLLVDPGVHESEIACLAQDIRTLGVGVELGFSTHPHWDHMLWHADLGAAPRYGTEKGAGAARHALSRPIEQIVKAAGIPEHVPLEMLGLISGLPPDTEVLSFDGPTVRIMEHQAHAPGHAALLLEDRGVLVCGDMVSDILIPLLDFRDTADPIDDYLAGLLLLESVAHDVGVFVPGHGSVGGTDQIHRRIAQDREYVEALRDGRPMSDRRLGPSAYGRDFLPGVHERQLERLAG